MRIFNLNRLASILALLLIGLTRLAADDDKGELGLQIIDKYVSTLAELRNALNGTEMEVSIDASLVKLHKTGRLNALRNISRIGQVTYKFLNFQGDDSIKRDVIGRYLTAESQAKQPPELLAVTPEFYKFKYKGTRPFNEREAHVFEIKPRKKKVGLFKGELWIDSQTYLPLREEGEFVKNPSVFLKKVKFLREYNIQDNLALLRRIESTVETRIVGKAEIAIDFRDMKKQSPELPASEALEEARSNQ